MAPREPDDPLGPKHRPRRRGYPSGLLILPVDPVEARDPVLRTEHERRSMVDSAVYVAGKRVASPQTLAETYAELRGTPPASPGSGCTVRTNASSRRWHGSSSCTSCRRGRRPGAPTAEARDATATRCSWCCAPRATSTHPRRSSSARYTSSSARTSWSRSGTARRPTSPPSAAAWRADPSLAVPGRRGDPLRDPGQRRGRLRAGRRGTGERHRRDRDRDLQRRPARCRDASTSCPARSSSSSGRPGRWAACCRR